MPAGEEDGIQVYFWVTSQEHDGRRLPTTRNIYYNIASVQNQGPGLYALMTSIGVGIDAPGWNRSLPCEGNPAGHPGARIDRPLLYDSLRL